MSLWCGDYEPAQAVCVDRVKARKEHSCDACGCTIRVGDHYTRDKMLYDGHWDLFERCERCQLIYDHLEDKMIGSDECVARALDCGHEYKEKWGEDPPPWLAALAFWMPGDPLPATNSCTALSTWSSPPKWFAPACHKNVAGCNSWGPWSIRGAASCRTNRVPSHTEVCCG